MMMMERKAAVTAVLLLAMIVGEAAAAHRPRGVTSTYRRKHQASDDMPLDADVFAVPPGRNAPQQVHITLGDQTGTAMLVSWVTAEAEGNSTVLYGRARHRLDHAAEGTTTRYTFHNYTSGFIHHCTLTGLHHATRYYYAMGFGDTVRTFWFTTPPAPGPGAPLRLGLIGDIGQTADSNSTLSHYEQHPGDAVLFVGDLSYADKHPLHDNNRWDTWGRFSERSVAYQPWLWTVGNHEIDYAPEIGETTPFKPFTHRYPTPYRASGSSEPYWYSVKMGPAHVIVLCSYCAFTKYTPQFKWLEQELKRVDRETTPWLFIMAHVPWYNSNNFHFMEGEPTRVQFEQMAVDARVDIVFAGHVHAYERSHRYSNIKYNITDGKCTPVADRRAPVYIVIGDGGNIEGLADELTWPQPAYSAFREYSFGPGPALRGGKRGSQPGPPISKGPTPYMQWRGPSLLRARRAGHQEPHARALRLVPQPRRQQGHRRHHLVHQPLPHAQPRRLRLRKRRCQCLVGNCALPLLLCCHENG